MPQTAALAIVVALVLDRVARARLVESTRHVAAVRFCALVVDALAAAREPRAAAVIVEGVDADGTPTDALIAVLRRERPSLPVLAYCEASTVASREIVAAVNAGASGLLFRGIDDVGLAARSAIERARGHAAATAVLRELGPDVPPSVRPIVEHCLRHAGRALSVQQVAAALGVHRKTVVSRLANADFPEPRILIGWCRLLHLGHALEDGSRPAERVALDLEFASPTAMRNMLRRYTGLRPGEVRENGGLTCVLHLFRRALADARARAAGGTATAPRARAAGGSVRGGSSAAGSAPPS
jgi:AraC-like DNA-binding protein